MMARMMPYSKTHVCSIHIQHARCLFAHLSCNHATPQKLNTHIILPLMAGPLLNHTHILSVDCSLKEEQAVSSCPRIRVGPSNHPGNTAACLVISSKTSRFIPTTAPAATVPPGFFLWLREQWGDMIVRKNDILGEPCNGWIVPVRRLKQERNRESEH